MSRDKQAILGEYVSYLLVCAFIAPVEHLKNINKNNLDMYVNYVLTPLFNVDSLYPYLILQHEWPLHIGWLVSLSSLNY